MYRDFRRGDTVCCCNLCNNLAGDYAAASVSEKASFIHDRYEKRFRKVLRLPRWTLEELQEMGHNLKRKIEANQELQRLLIEKLKNLDLVMNGYPPVPIDKLEFYFGRQRAEEAARET